MTVSDKFCVVVRTYRGHADQHSGVPRLLRSLQRQSITNWEAVLLVMDGAPFPELHPIVAHFDDPRIWVFAEWIGPDFAARVEGGLWAPHYHSLLYNLTDDAVIACPEDTTWLLVTNGDNEYADGFFERAASEGAAGADVVAFDFYSRYQRPTAPQCLRLASAPPATSACKRNRLAWCHTDLGANVLRYARFVAEQRGFGKGTRPSGSPDLPAEHADGLLAAALVDDGWAVAHVADACLFSHSPSAQACAWAGGAWDDRDMMTGQGTGGDCISGADLAWIQDNDPNAEVVHLELSNDGNVGAFGSAAAWPTGAPLTIQCVRRRNYLSPEILGATMDWYSELCMDEVDRESMEAWRDEGRILVPGVPNPGDKRVGTPDSMHVVPAPIPAHQDL